MKKKGGRGPDYVQERTGLTRRSPSHGMTLSSNRITIRAGAARNQLPPQKAEAENVLCQMNMPCNSGS